MSRSVHLASQERLLETVSRLTRGWIRLAREEARRRGFSLPQLFLLNGLRDTGRIPVTRWTETVGASPSATTGLLDSLESAGYLVRSHDARDRRQVLIGLTQRGHRLADRVRSQSRKRWATFCREISSADLDAASETLGRIVNRMGASPHRAAPARARRATLRRRP